MTTTDIHADTADELARVLDLAPEQIQRRTAGLRARQRIYAGTPDMARHCRTQEGILAAALDPIARAHLRLYVHVHLPGLA